MKFMRYETKDLTRAAGGAVSLLVIIAALSSCALFGPAPNPLVGTWNVTVVSPLGTSEQSMTVDEDMTGFVHVPEDNTTIPIMNLLLEGQTVTFDIDLEVQGQKLAAKFNGTLDGDNISGVFVTDFGNATVTGKRAE